MKFIFKYLLLFILVLTSCSNPTVIQHPYYYNNAKGLQIKGTVYGLEDMNHFNAMETEDIEHELVDDTKAKVKIVGKINVYHSPTNIFAQSSKGKNFEVFISEPLGIDTSLIGKTCIFQGKAQMDRKREGLIVEADAMIILD